MYLYHNTGPELAFFRRQQEGAAECRFQLCLGLGDGFSTHVPEADRLLQGAEQVCLFKPAQGMRVQCNRCTPSLQTIFTTFMTIGPVA